MTDLALLQPRVTAATAPLPDQALIADLWDALEETQATLAAAQNLIAILEADPASVASFQAQIRDLTAQRDDALLKLAAANLALTADQQTLADLKLADQQLIAELNRTIDGLKVSIGSLQQQLGSLKSADDANVALIASLRLQLAGAQQQISLLSGQLATAQAALSAAQSKALADAAEIKRLNQVVVDQRAQITLLQGQLGGTPNLAPVWKTVPDIKFSFGNASEIDLGQYVSDPNGDQLLPLRENSIQWPPGVTFDPMLMKLRYDGKGAAGPDTLGHMLTADDGRG